MLPESSAGVCSPDRACQPGRPVCSSCAFLVSVEHICSDSMKSMQPDTQLEQVTQGGMIPNVQATQTELKVPEGGMVPGGAEATPTPTAPPTGGMVPKGPESGFPVGPGGERVSHAPATGGTDGAPTAPPPTDK